VDQSTRVPLGDPTYRDTYYGFAHLAVPIIALVYFIALLSAAFRRDPRALVRATLGIVVAAIGGLAYVLFAQLLVGLDDWLSHGVVAVTGADFGQKMTEMAQKFQLMGSNGEVAADFLMLILMFITLVAGVCLWVVLLLRKMAILVVVAFAPFLMAGWLWPPTRSWSRKATEVLIALVFSKTVIYVIFGIGMSMLLRDKQTLSDLVGVVVLLCGACFAPLVMLRLVHFATDSHLAADMVGTLRAGAQPAINRVSSVHVPHGNRKGMASDYASRPHTTTARGAEATVPRVASGASGASSSGAAGAGTSAPAAGASGAAAAGGPAVVAAAGASAAAKKARQTGASGAKAMSDIGNQLGPPTSGGPTHEREG
jgi:hypothetical protein